MTQVYRLLFVPRRNLRFILAEAHLQTSRTRSLSIRADTGFKTGLQ